MKIKVLYFARLKESLNYSEEEMDLPDDVTNVNTLKQFLASRGDTWKSLFAETSSTRAAINHTLVDNQAPLKQGDEVAFFPPVTGG